MALTAAHHSTFSAERQPTCLDRVRSNKNTVLWVTAAALLVDSLVYSVVIPILPLFVTATLRLDEQDVGFLFASYAGGLLVATPLFGLASDRFGRRAPMLLGLLGLAAATMGFAFAQSYWQLVLARVAQGVSGAASFVVGLAMISDAFPVDEVGGALGLVMGVNAIGFLVGPTIGGVMFERLGFRAPFFLCAALAVADFVARYALVSDEALLAMHAQSMRDSASLSSGSSASSALDAGGAGAGAGTFDAHSVSVILAASDGSGGRVRVPVSSSSSSSFASSASSRLGSPAATQKTVSYGSFAAADNSGGDCGGSLRVLTLTDLLRDRGVQIIFYCNTAIAMFFVGLEPIWALHLQQDFACSPSTIGYLFLVVVIPNAVGSGVAGAWSDRYSKVKLIGVGMVALAAVIPCMAIFRSPPQLVYFCLVLAVVGFVAAIPLTPILPLMSAIVTAKNSRSFGQAYSVFTISYSLGTFVGPIVAGALFQRVGFLWTMIAFCAIVLSALPVLMCADLAYADTVAVDSDGGGESGGPSASGAAGDSTAATVSTPLVSSAQASDDRAAAAAAAARIDAVTAALQDAADMGAGAHDGDDEDEEAGGGGGSYRRLPALTASDRVSP